ncbi:MAG TPA: ATP-binding protein [Methylomirabilota bacterium]|nr:ATP-binding protein [Methylomirabilota bacterium]
MLHKQGYRFWRAVAQYLSGGIALALLTFVCFRIGLDLATTAVLYLILITLLSLQGSFLLSAILSLIGVGCLAYYFAPPIFSFHVSDPLNAVAIIAFLTTSAVITHLVSRVRKSTETLREQAALLDLTHDTVFVRDVNDVITYWNRGAEELYGRTRNEAVGKNSHDLNQTVFPAPFEDIKAELIRTGRWDGELIHTRRDGTKVVVASRWSLQRDGQGRPAGTLETNNDITERKRAEEALQRSQAELAHVTRVTTLGELAASIAHEINQPLAAIVADANACLNWLAADRPDLDSVREALAAIMKDGDRAAEVITRIRALLSRSSVPHEPCDLAGVIREVHPLVRPELGRHGITLEMSLATDVPAVMGDRIQLQQVLLNLLMNAAEAVREVPPQRRRLVVRSTVEDRDDGPWAVVAVEDAGVGFGEDEAARLFEAFYTTKADGLGMGLSISRSIIDNHRGRLWATANPDHGATFHLVLPGIR